MRVRRQRMQDEGSAEHQAFMDAEMARGELAFQPDTMPCWECGGFDGVTAPERAVVAVMAPTGGADPSSRYRLVCGHIALA